MQLDQTHVVVRKRMQTEIADLALVMIREYPTALLFGLTLGAIPWAVLNWCLLGWIPIREAEFGLSDDDAALELYRYLAWMTLLVFAQAPAAGAWTTYYLGQAVFEKRPTWTSVRNVVRKQFSRWFWHLAVIRLAVPAMIFLAFRWGQPFDQTADFVVYFGVMAWMLIARAGRPFLPEVILLEQCPTRSKNPNVVTLHRRMRILHKPMAGELTARMFNVAVAATLGVLALFYTFCFLRGIALGQWNQDSFSYLVLFPASLWLIAIVSVYYRLLNYLDTRIRLEGWEVELAVRAEEVRQFGEETGLQSPAVATLGSRREPGP